MLKDCHLYREGTRSYGFFLILLTRYRLCLTIEMGRRVSGRMLFVILVTFFAVFSPNNKINN